MNNDTMGNDISMAIEQAFAREIGISIYAAMKILNEAGITTEDLSEIANLCKATLTNEVERRNVPYEFRFLLLSFILCRMFKTSTSFHNEYMESVKNTLYEKGEKCQDIEIEKRP